MQCRWLAMRRWRTSRRRERRESSCETAGTLAAYWGGEEKAYGHHCLSDEIQGVQMVGRKGGKRGRRKGEESWESRESREQRGRESREGEKRVVGREKEGKKRERREGRKRNTKTTSQRYRKTTSWLTQKAWKCALRRTNHRRIPCHHRSQTNTNSIPVAIDTWPQSRYGQDHLTRSMKELFRCLANCTTWEVANERRKLTERQRLGSRGRRKCY